VNADPSSHEVAMPKGSEAASSMPRMLPPWPLTCWV